MKNQKNQKKTETVTINPGYKEIYYSAGLSELKESPKAIEHRHVVWNHMMNLSMQNAVTQMIKRA